MKYPHNVLLSVHGILLRKKQIWLYATWMNFKNIMLNKKNFDP